MEREAIIPRGGALAIGAYSPLIKFDKLIYSSGQIALNPLTNKLFGETVKEQAMAVMENIKILLKEGDSSFEQMLKVTIYLTNMDDFRDVNFIYESYFSHSYPARSTVEVKALPLGALIEIDFIAYSS